MRTTALYRERAEEQNNMKRRTHVPDRSSITHACLNSFPYTKRQDTFYCTARLLNSRVGGHSLRASYRCVLTVCIFFFFSFFFSSADNIVHSKNIVENHDF